MADSILNVFEHVEFMIQIIIAEILCIKNFRRCKYFILRAIISIIICVIVSYILIEYEFLWQTFEILLALEYLLMFVVTIAAMKFCYSNSFWSILFCAAAGYAMQHLAYCMRAIFDNILSIESATFLILGTILVYGIVYTALYFLFIRKMKEEGFSNINNKKLIIVIMLSAVLCIFVSAYAYLVNNEGVIVYRSTMMIACFLLLSYQFGLLDNSYIKKENDTMQRLLHEFQEQYLMTKDNIELVNIKCHDIKQQIRLLSGKGKIDDESLAEIENIITIYDSTVKTGNEIVDIILSEKSLYCERNNIMLGCMVDGEKLSFINSMDLYSLFGNMIENAIDAVKKVSDPEKAVISLTVKAESKLLIIHCENYFDGNLRFENNLPITTKPNTQYHGYGFKSIRHIVEKYGGTMSIIPDDEIFNINIVIPIKNQ